MGVAAKPPWRVRWTVGKDRGEWGEFKSEFKSRKDWGKGREGPIFFLFTY